jgi:CBS domain-containing protein
MKVSDVLASKGNDVATIAPAAGVTELVRALAEFRVGALVVVDDGGGLVGIVSERDVARGLHAHGSALLEMTVGDLMTHEVQTCTPDDPIGNLARIMTNGRFRHMPVLIDGRLAGIVSIGDIVKKRIDELEIEQDQLFEYISTAQ